MTDQIVPPVGFREGKRAAGEAVGNPVVVNPKSPFRAVAEQRGWEVVEWKDRHKPGEQPDLADEWGSWDG